MTAAHRTAPTGRAAAGSAGRWLVFFLFFIVVGAVLMAQLSDAFARWTAQRQLDELRRSSLEYCLRDAVTPTDTDECLRLYSRP